MEADLKRTVEALLFASPEPLSLPQLQSILPSTDRKGLRAILAELAADYDAAGHAFQLSELGGGWRVLTRPEHARHIETLLKGQRRVRLSRASLECLAVVAYRQPCTRVDVEAVRGVNCGGSLATLMERNLIRITGRAETLGRPLLYSTSEEFLSHLGINSLEELPKLTEIEALLNTREDEEDSSVPADARRERLVEGMDAIAAVIAEQREALGEAQDIVPEDDAEAEGDVEDAAVDGEGASELPEHRAVMDAALAEERAELAEAPAMAMAAVAAAAGNGGGTLSRLARALTPTPAEADDALDELAAAADGDRED
ncbi:MAG: SMC-Scp complex subunit ScpB [Candidatus Krumholzibacteriia bacterium]|nr:SMC-Scp complex subunit ScpB [bacterium]MCB9515148.1 SMC-Scp complex subunit ScpB [Candidatus Latescibacterota bacterium]